MYIQSAFRQPATQLTAPEAAESGLMAHAQVGTVTLHAPGSTIYAEGDRTSNLYYVEFGTVRICRLTADGRRQISAFHFAGEVFGFEPGRERHFYAEAVDSAGLRVLRPKTDGGFAQAALPLALESLAKAQEHLLLLGRQNGVEKVAAFLLDMAERQGSEHQVELTMQRNDIADYLGLSFETVSRILTKLKTARIIRIPHIKSIQLVDIEALQDLRC